MDTPPDVLRGTQARFLDRSAPRGVHLERLNTGSILTADAPQRVEARLTRLGVSLPDAQAVVEGREDPALLAARLPDETRLSLERLLGANDLVGVAYLDLARSATRAVGRVVLRTPQGRTLGYGTGWLCSPRVLITNHHVLESAADARTAVVEFNYELRPDGTLRDRVTLPLDPDTLFITSEPLDYTLVAVTGDTRPFGWLPCFGSADKHVIGEALSIIQHPSGEPKQVALRENRLVDRLPDFLHYETDTAPGSSGSPVFNDAWEVVALHHSGVPRRDAQGRVLRRDGQPAAPGTPDTEIDWIANEGVRVSRLLQDLRGRPEASSALIQEVLRAPRPDPTAEERSGATPLTLDLGTLTPGPDGRVTLPLNVTLRVNAAPPAGEPQPDRPYLDPADTGQVSAYYAGLPEQPDFAALSDLVQRTHTRPRRYDPATHLYPWVDLWPDGQLRSLYSGQVHAPQELIRADRAAAERRERLAAQEALNADALEDALPYNCEHVVPQSWFGKAEPMRGDLHHLFACEPDCNSFRGNTPYFDFPDYGEVIRSACGRREPGEFEPARGKGAAARATLYFLLRYPGVIRTYAPRHLQTLLAWHAAEEPGDWERHRNAAIHATQGNRNPLIDHPEWAAHVNFSAGLGA
ncbi:endonuclease [Deinococcus taeanensis]|uniref:endonuclease n=1 Tax=Deinococcus taeanensis TaxID=2737050 RepID=UPI001CDD0F1E|nr:endonuclease [Deinococcus taeanensis]UBV42168.1 endonuclease [Deinococcus taeanensis]